MNREWVPIGGPLTQQDAEYLRDLFHQAGFPARVERLDGNATVVDGRGWMVWTPPEHEEEAAQIHDRYFNGPTRRPTRRWKLTGLLRNRRRAA